jgi:hypothetical protein
MNKRRRVVINGQSFYIDRDDERWWYVVIEDPKHGACIDSRVPLGMYRTLREAKAALLEMYQGRIAC